MIEPDKHKADKSTESELVIAADLGGTNLRVATIDRQGQIHERVKQRTPKAEKASEIVHAIVTAARECERRSIANGAQIISVSVVVPGSV